ncbi:MAG TPA: HD domain-containing protein [Ktedonobacteraceae bacterium]|nr:HD domain-containing protein [Ktedonobacteraceae bacterium]
MERDVVQAVARHAEEAMGQEGFQQISATVASCKMLALELEGQEQEQESGMERPEAGNGAIDMEALVLAGYLHDISVAVHGSQNHHIKSAEMAVAFLETLDVPAERVRKVEQILLAHTTRVPADERHKIPIEGRILYDATNLGHLSGLAVVTALIEFGARYRERYRNREINGEILSAVLRHMEERFIELYQSLYTAPAREMAREKFDRTLAFIDGVIEHLSDSTPV